MTMSSLRLALRRSNLETFIFETPNFFFQNKECISFVMPDADCVTALSCNLRESVNLRVNVIHFR